MQIINNITVMLFLNVNVSLMVNLSSLEMALLEFPCLSARGANEAVVENGVSNVGKPVGGSDITN